MGLFHPRKTAGNADPIWKAYEELDRSQWMTLQQLEALQLRRLQTLLTHCYEAVPYYRRVLQEAGYPARPINSLDDLRRVPLLTRDLYQRNFESLQATQLPPGMTAVSSSYTSGTNGVPIQVRK